MRRIFVALFAVVVIVVLVGLAFLYQSQSATVTVEMRLGEGTVDYRGSQVPNYLFSPASITIKKGTTVKWINKDPSGSHAITTSYFGTDQPPVDMAVLSPNGEWSYAFNVDPGPIFYWDSQHPWMNGTVTVTP
jgi:plastocyanin